MWAIVPFTTAKRDIFSYLGGFLAAHLKKRYYSNQMKRYINIDATLFLNVSFKDIFYSKNNSNNKFNYKKKWY